jgi:hypothetical protein
MTATFSSKQQQQQQQQHAIVIALKEVVSSLYRFVLNLICHVIADILEHPRVQQAAAQAIVAGMNATTEQPDLPKKAATLYLNMQTENEYISRRLGEQFPKVAANFIAGAASSFRLPGTPSKDQRSKNKINKAAGSSIGTQLQVVEDMEPEIQGENRLSEQWTGFVEKFKKKDNKKVSVNDESSSSLLLEDKENNNGPDNKNSVSDGGGSEEGKLKNEASEKEEGIQTAISGTILENNKKDI